MPSYVALPPPPLLFLLGVTDLINLVLPPPPLPGALGWDV